MLSRTIHLAARAEQEGRRLPLPTILAAPSLGIDPTGLPAPSPTAASQVPAFAFATREHRKLSRLCWFCPSCLELTAVDGCAVSTSGLLLDALMALLWRRSVSNGLTCNRAPKLEERKNLQWNCRALISATLGDSDLKFLLWDLWDCRFSNKSIPGASISGAAHHQPGRCPE